MILINYKAILFSFAILAVVFTGIVSFTLWRFPRQRERLFALLSLAICFSLYATLRLEWPVYDLVPVFFALFGWVLLLPYVVVEAISTSLWPALILALGLLALLCWISGQVSRARMLVLVPVFAVLTYEVPMSVQSFWSDRSIQRQANRLGLELQSTLPFRVSVKNHYLGRSNWFEYLHGRACQNGNLFLWSYRANKWEAFDQANDRHNRNLNSWCS